LLLPMLAHQQLRLLKTLTFGLSALLIPA